VQEDIASGRVTRAWAEQIYGVVLDASNQVDLEATLARREQIRQQRLAGFRGAIREKVHEHNARQVSEGLLLVEKQQGYVLACRKCQTELCAATENYKQHCALTVLPVTAANPHVLDPKLYVDDEIVFRNYACPACGVLIETEIARPDDPPLAELQLFEESQP
jgi:N-methylhydantoinase B